LMLTDNDDDNTPPGKRMKFTAKPKRKTEVEYQEKVDGRA